MASGLLRGALGENALQRAAVHAQAAGGFRHVAVAQFVNPLDVLPANPVGRHRMLGRRGLGLPAGHQRGINGVYHHVSQQHLKRYLGEFDFRYNERLALGVTDSQRAEKVLRGSVGKRVTYQETNGKDAANAG